VEWTASGRFFHTRAAAAPNAWWPMVRSHVCDTISSWVVDDRRHCGELFIYLFEVSIQATQLSSSTDILSHSLHGALEVIFNEICYINLCFTYLLTYLLLLQLCGNQKCITNTDICMTDLEENVPTCSGDYSQPGFHQTQLCTVC